MREVTQLEFFRLLAADPRDIMPNVEHEDHHLWLVRPTRAVWGWSAPGWKNPGAYLTIYAVRETP